jgi:protein phosphatase
MEIQVLGITDIGRQRENNEDFYIINDKLNLYAVADGMGGHSGGEFASKIAIQAIEENLDRIIDTSVEEKPNTNILQILENAVHDASSVVKKKSHENKTLQGMGTTTTLALFDNNKAYFAHVGDSRAYLFRDNNLQQLTEDHSLGYEQFKYGLITKEELKTFQYKNIITRSVGVQEDIVIDTFYVDLRSKDLFLLCTDGLTNMILDDELKNILANYQSYETLKTLIETANNHGGDDNITLILVKIINDSQSLGVTATKK